MIPTAFAHVALNCNDPLLIERYYTQHFGFQRARVVELGKDQIVFLKLGSFYLELFKATAAAPTPAADKDGPDWPGVRHLAFQVEDVDAKLAEMGSAALVNLGPFDFHDFIPGWRTVWLADPEGNVVEVTQGFCDQTDPPIDAACLAASC